MLEKIKALKAYKEAKKVQLAKLYPKLIRPNNFKVSSI